MPQITLEPEHSSAAPQALPLIAEVGALFAHAPLAVQLYDDTGTSAWMNEANRALLCMPSVTYGVGVYNILTDPWSKTNGYDGLYRRAYAGELVHLPAVVVNFADPENRWATRGDSRVLSQTVLPLPDRESVVQAVLTFTTDVTDLAVTRTQIDEIHSGLAQRSLARAADLAAALVRLEAEAAARQQAEADLAEREALVQALFSNAAVGMALVDPAGRLLLVNEAFAQFLEAEPHDLAGMDLTTLVHPDDVSLDDGQRAELLLGTRRSYTVDKRFLGKCGAVVWG
ncbi:MAG: PAS domain S-box protein, partial [Chloroflexales bacterium]|nr:PAS domain S-box protein [Chloroflexales bacterium]